MAARFARPHHQLWPNGPSHTAPNAALLIDFDNVTMGIRSDLSKELKNLLNSDIIKGKVAVQRAYADWRRYPQYIVPLSEASVDLIFAPAYGSAKKNATDIRLAIDALELVFTRPEIGTYILLSGDSDFSSLVLKLKEYGKYVIGVGIRESASDLLVQNCDEYYSYSILSGLTKESEEERQRQDPWELVERAVRQMVARRDVMRSDRLKQVMLELDPTFNEKELGYSKFSRFLTEAVSKRKVRIRKAPNGQMEIFPAEERDETQATEPTSKPEPKSESRTETRTAREQRSGRDEPRSRRGGRTRETREQARAQDRPQERGETPEVRRQPVPEEVVAEAAGEPHGDLRAAYDLLRRATEFLIKRNGDPARDSDIKRRMLELEPGWDESTLGFSKFSRFLRQAHDAEVIDLHRLESGNYEVALVGGRAPRRSTRTTRGRARAEAHSQPERQSEREQPQRERTPRAEKTEESERPAKTRRTARVEKPKAEEPKSKDEAPAVQEVSADQGATPRGIGVRLGTRGRNIPATPPPILPGQVVGPPTETPATSSTEGQEPTPKSPPSEETLTERLGLPTDERGIRRHILGRYKGVGVKTIEALLEAFGAEDLFGQIDENPERVREVLGRTKRAEHVIEGWKADKKAREKEAAKKVRA